MRASDFDAFFTALHGYAPFPWQRRLAEQVVDQGAWPEVLGLPTSAGKTAVLDIAVFALACEAERRPSERRAPMRIFFVIDRRIVVDEAHRRALHIRERLVEPGGSAILRDVAQRLEDLGGEEPLRVSALRGGMYRDPLWTRSPVQPTICVSTVDQVGSRLLFRGYGVGPYARPIHAGLVGNDALIFLDEAHLSQPFLETVRAVDRYRGWQEAPLRTPFQVVSMSATPASDQDIFRVTDEDRRHEVLGRRLRASKKACLVPVPVARGSSSVEGTSALATAAATSARELVTNDAAVRVVGVVVNRVASARAIFEALARDPQADAILLTGRVRPHDREVLLKQWLPRMRAGRDRSAETRALFVVATQCIEAGADLDFDALVTECASLDALQQRFGRLDRLGERGASSAIILARSDQIGQDDPIYGGAASKTWKWLEEHAKPQGSGKKAAAVVDFGIEALSGAVPSGEARAGLCAPERHAPILLPAHLDTWVQTSPVPEPDPDVSVFLHGPKAGPADVQIVWRADLDPDNASDWADIIALVPPLSSEAMPVPLHAARAWLEQSGERDVADIEGVAAEADKKPEPGDPRPALRWGGIDRVKLVERPDELRPGDTLVVPSSYGGSDAYGWKPESAEPVKDVAEEASLAQRRTAILRLHAHVIHSLFAKDTAAWDILNKLRSLPWNDRDDTSSEAELLERLAAAPDVPAWMRRVARALGRQLARVSYPDEQGVVLMAKEKLPPEEGAPEEGVHDFTSEDDSSLLTVEVTLEAHSEGVRDFVKRFASSGGVAPEVVSDIELAAWLHDVGKADPRFQVMLHGGDEVAAVMADALLAKSSMNPRNRKALADARERSGYPRGGRHELQSVALVAHQAELRERAKDWDLVLHLVGSHHGRCRPFAPVVLDPRPAEVRVRHGEIELSARSDHGLERIDSGVSDRFWRLISRYGWFGLAYLETILRLSDHRRSEEEQEQVTRR